MLRLPPSRTFTLAAFGIFVLALIALTLIAMLVVLFVLGKEAGIAAAVLENIGSCIWGIAGCSGVGAGAMSLRDSVSKGKTTSGEQLLEAQEAAGGG